MSTTLSRRDLIRAAKLRDSGATWNEIRAEFGVTTPSAQWQRMWEREGIPHMPSRDIGTKNRLATLKANREANGGVGATTKRSRSPTGNAAARPIGERKCAACGYRGSPLDRHHVVYRRDMVARGVAPRHFHDPRNMVWLCAECHRRQDSGAPRLVLSMLPAGVFEFAAEVLGTDAAREYLSSHYGGDAVDTLDL